MADVNETRAPSFVAFSVIFIVLSSLAVGLRLLSRRISAANFWWDDALIVVSLVGDSKTRSLHVSNLTGAIFWFIYLALLW